MPFEGNGLHKAVEILRKTEPRFGVDIIVRTPDDLRQRIEWNDQFLKEIVGKGRVLYATPNG